jgi:redox-sensitive bicupin YhaK (pirin superfamily)
MATKSIAFVAAPQEPHFVGDGFRVHNFIPGARGLSMQRMDPFIMLDYNSKFYFSPANKPKGVGVHPHRGFETVTIAYKGRVAHNDSSGGGGVIKEGDVQWMTAASGILHKEYHEAHFSKTGGDFQMVQLWVNLPAKYKMSKPKYQAIENKDINRYKLSNNGGEIEVIAGAYKNVPGTASTFTHMNLINAKMNAGGVAEFSFPVNYNSALLVIEGEVIINDSANVPADHFVLFENDGDAFTIKAVTNAVVLILGGEPINEPIATHGPFVMNTKAELIQAFDDYNKGKFGYLED